VPYIGNEPTSVAFLTDTFSGNASATAFTLSAAPATTSSILVAVSGVLQDPSTYSSVGTTLNFSAAPPSGTDNISVRFLGIPASGVTTTAYRTVTEFTATASQTTFSVPSYTVGFIDVYRNGVMLGSADYTATSGVSVVLAAGATAGDLVEVISFQVSSVLNAIPATAGSVGSSNIANGVTINFADGSASTPSITNDGDTNTGIFFPAADTIAFAEGGVESMRITSAGNVGIGTSSPAAKFHIKAGNANQAYFDNAGEQYTQVTWQNNGTDKAAIWTDNTNSTFSLYAYPSLAMNFFTGGSERMRIDSSGNLSVGATGALTSNLLARANIQGSVSNAPAIAAAVSGASYTGSVLSLGSGTNSGSGWNLIQGYSANGGSDQFAALRFQVRGDGNVTNSNNSYGAISDIKIKENIVDATPKLEKLNQVRVVNYNLIGSEQKQIGVVAQELEQIFPSMIDESPDTDAEGNDLGTTTKSVKYSVFVPMLIKAIQEQQAIITDLKARVEALENK
jgi:hypothetical protein